MDIFIADFETIERNGKECIWLWDVCTGEGHKWGYDIESFIKWLDSLTGVVNIKFHNLKFDGCFIIDWLLSNGYTFTPDGNFNNLKLGEFSAFVAPKNIFYHMSLISKSGGHIIISDSLKLIPMSVRAMAKTFGLKIQKGEIDYKKPRPVGYIPTDEEMDYIVRDTEIVYKCYKMLNMEGMRKSTVSSCALHEYKRLLGYKYDKWFSAWEKACNLELDQFIRRAYFGGIVQVNDRFHAKTIKQPVYYYDVNSMYPHIMRHCPLPYGMPKYYKGKYVENKEYTTYVQHIIVDFLIQYDYIPHIQDKMTLATYIRETDAPIEMWLTKPDLERLLKNGDIYQIEYLDGYMFMEQTGMFDEYVDIHYKGKAEEKAKGNKGKCMIHKLYLNSLYGKFGEHPLKHYKIPYMEDGLLKFALSKETVADRFKYLPLATFITALARNYLLDVIELVGIDNFVYCDTDSVKIVDVELHKSIIDNYNIQNEKDMRAAMKYHELPLDGYKAKTKKGDIKVLGAWEHDGEYQHFKTLGAKRYMVYQGDDLSLTVSGVNKKFAVPYMRDQYTIDECFDAFNNGLIIPEQFTGKLTHYYIDKEYTGTITDYKGVSYDYDSLSGIFLEPAAYEFDITADYINFLKGIYYTK